MHLPGVPAGLLFLLLVLEFAPLFSEQANCSGGGLTEQGRRLIFSSMAVSLWYKICKLCGRKAKKKQKQSLCFRVVTLLIYVCYLKEQTLERVEMGKRERWVWKPIERRKRMTNFFSSFWGMGKVRGRCVWVFS